MCTDKLLQEMKGASSYSKWSCLIDSFVKKSDKSFVKKSDKWPPVTGSYGMELHIWDFSGSADVRDLKMKMARFASFTHQNEEEIMVVIHKIEKMMDNISLTIEDMSRHAHLYRLDIREAGVTLNQLIVDNRLLVNSSGASMLPYKVQYGGAVSEAMTVLYQATLSLILTDLQWYMLACEEEADDSSLLSCDSIIHSNIINIICGPGSTGGGKSLEDIHKVITRLQAINQESFTVLSECKEDWRHDPMLFHLVNGYHKICLQTSQLYNEFVMLLKGQCDSGLSVILTLKEFVTICNQDDHMNYEEEMISHLNYDERFMLCGDLLKSLAYICKQTVAFRRQFDEEIQELKSVKVLAKASSGLTAGVFSMMATYMVDCKPVQWMEKKTLACVWLHVIRSFSWRSPFPLQMGEQLVIKILSDVDELLREVKCTMSNFGYVYKKNMMIAIDAIEKKMEKLLVTVEEMSSHAHKCSDDIINAGFSLELTAYNPMLGIKRKRRSNSI